MKKILAIIPAALICIGLTTPAVNAVPPHVKVEDASDTLSEVWTKDPTIRVMANRTENYYEIPAKYVYKSIVFGLEGTGKCLVKKDSKVLQQVPCGWDSAVETEMEESGNYVLETKEGKKLASWVFTRPTAKPAPPAPAECVVKQVTPKYKNNTIVLFKIKTNKKCNQKTGYWSYIYSDPNVTGVNLGLGGLYQANATTLTGYDFIDKKIKPLNIPANSRVTITYAPDAFIENTKVEFLMTQ